MLSYDDSVIAALPTLPPVTPSKNPGWNPPAPGYGKKDPNAIPAGWREVFQTIGYDPVDIWSGNVPSFDEFTKRILKQAKKLEEKGVLKVTEYKDAVRKAYNILGSLIRERGGKAEGHLNERLSEAETKVNELEQHLESKKKLLHSITRKDMVELLKKRLPQGAGSAPSPESLERAERAKKIDEKEDVKVTGITNKIKGWLVEEHGPQSVATLDKAGGFIKGLIRRDFRREFGEALSGYLGMGIHNRTPEFEAFIDSFSKEFEGSAQDQFFKMIFDKWVGENGVSMLNGAWMRGNPVSEEDFLQRSEQLITPLIQKNDSAINALLMAAPPRVREKGVKGITGVFVGSLVSIVNNLVKKTAKVEMSVLRRSLDALSDKASDPEDISKAIVTVKSLIQDEIRILEGKTLPGLKTERDKLRNKIQILGIPPPTKFVRVPKHIPIIGDLNDVLELLDAIKLQTPPGEIKEVPVSHHYKWLYDIRQFDSLMKQFDSFVGGEKVEVPKAKQQADKEEWGPLLSHTMESIWKAIRSVQENLQDATRSLTTSESETNYDLQGYRGKHKHFEMLSIPQEVFQKFKSKVRALSSGMPKTVFEKMIAEAQIGNKVPGDLPAEHHKDFDSLKTFFEGVSEIKEHNNSASSELDKLIGPLEREVVPNFAHAQKTFKDLKKYEAFRVWETGKEPVPFLKSSSVKTAYEIIGAAPALFNPGTHFTAIQDLAKELLKLQSADKWGESTGPVLKAKTKDSMMQGLQASGATEGLLEDFYPALLKFVGACRTYIKKMHEFDDSLRNPTGFIKTSTTEIIYNLRKAAHLLMVQSAEEPWTFQHGEMQSPSTHPAPGGYKSEYPAGGSLQTHIPQPIPGSKRVKYRKFDYFTKSFPIESFINGWFKRSGGGEISESEILKRVENVVTKAVQKSGVDVKPAAISKAVQDAMKGTSSLDEGDLNKKVPAIFEKLKVPMKDTRWVVFDIMEKGGTSLDPAKLPEAIDEVLKDGGWGDKMIDKQFEPERLKSDKKKLEDRRDGCILRIKANAQSIADQGEFWKGVWGIWDEAIEKAKAQRALALPGIEDTIKKTQELYKNAKASIDDAIKVAVNKATQSIEGVSVSEGISNKVVQEAIAGAKSNVTQYLTNLKGLVHRYREWGGSKPKQYSKGEKFPVVDPMADFENMHTTIEKLEQKASAVWSHFFNLYNRSIRQIETDQDLLVALETGILEHDEMITEGVSKEEKEERKRWLIRGIWNALDMAWMGTGKFRAFQSRFNINFDNYMEIHKKFEELAGSKLTSHRFLQLLQDMVEQAKGHVSRREDVPQGLKDQMEDILTRTGIPNPGLKRQVNKYLDRKAELEIRELAPTKDNVIHVALAYVGINPRALLEV